MYIVFLYNFLSVFECCSIIVPSHDVFLKTIYFLRSQKMSTSLLY